VEMWKCGNVENVAAVVGAAACAVGAVAAVAAESGDAGNSWTDRVVAAWRGKTGAWSWVACCANLLQDCYKHRGSY
jgi:hypothetical protein